MNENVATTSNESFTRAVNEAVGALHTALGNFLQGEAYRHANPCRLVRPDGLSEHTIARAGECERIEAATTALQDVLIKQLVDSAPPGMREAILASQKTIAAAQVVPEDAPNALDGRDETNGVAHDE